MMIEEFCHPSLVFYRTPVSNRRSVCEMDGGLLTFEGFINRLHFEIVVGYLVPLIRLDGKGAEPRGERVRGHGVDCLNCGVRPRMEGVLGGKELCWLE